MKIVAGLGSIDEYRRFADAGADEFFCGYVPYSWAKKYGTVLPLNRREVLCYNVQLGAFSELEILTELVKKYGNKLTAKWVYGMVIYTDEGVSKFTWSKDDFYLVDKPIEKRNVGYPLDSISVIPETGKYFAELVEQKDEKYKKKESIEKVINFIVESLNS